MIRAILTDIEGTTSALDFVKGVLFPYARERIASFVRTHGGTPELAQQLGEVRSLCGEPLDDQQVIHRLVTWIDEDRKVTPLKAIQGMIWEQGYRRGDFRGHVYADAVRKLKEWHSLGIPLYVFSSGSVEAQKLLFGHTEYGDLTAIFSGYFDTRVGSKQDPDSYRTISSSIGVPPESILFLSDAETELDAARAAGLSTWKLVRDPGVTEESSHPQARSFDEVQFGASD